MRVKEAETNHLERSAVSFEKILEAAKVYQEYYSMSVFLQKYEALMRKKNRNTDKAEVEEYQDF